MRISSALFVIGLCLGVTNFAACKWAHAQTVVGSPSLALKNGETVEIGPVYYVSHCKSLLTSIPQAEILEGPSGVSLAVKEAMVLPRLQGCGNKVSGGILSITAQGVEESSYSKLTIRITYKTRDGERKLSQVYNLSLFQ
jgi:hypothetical protein